MKNLLTKVLTASFIVALAIGGCGDAWAQVKQKVSTTKTTTKTTKTVTTKTTTTTKSAVTTKTGKVEKMQKLSLKKLKVGRAAAPANLLNADKKMTKADFLKKGGVNKKFVMPTEKRSANVKTRPANLKSLPSVRKVPRQIARGRGVARGSSSQSSSSSSSSSTTTTTQQVVGDELMFTSSGFNPYVSYTAIDNAVKNLNIPSNTSIEDAARQIISTSRATTIKQKARALFTWIAHHISYDVRYYTSRDDAIYDAEQAWAQRKGVCQAYSLLFQQMGQAVGLEVDYVSGYGKNSSHTVGTEINGRHGWNVVYDTGKKPILLDVTWGAGYIDENNRFNYSFKDYWFDVDPYAMIFSHWPRNFKHQFTNTLITKSQFEMMPDYRPYVFYAGIDPKELHKFLSENRNGWAIDSYSDLATVIMLGVKLNKVQVAKELQVNKEYTFNFTIPSGINAYLKVGNNQYTINSNQDVVVTPTQTGDVCLYCKYDDSGYWGTLKYKVTATGSQVQNGCMDIAVVTTSYPASVYDELAYSTIDAQGVVTIPEGRKVIKEDEFYERTDVKKVILPSSLEEIGEYAFWKTNITSVEVPESVQKIGKCAFAYAPLTEAETYASDIGDHAFWSSTVGTQLRLAPSVQNIGQSVIVRAGKLVVTPNTPAYTYAENNNFAYMIEE